MIIRQYLAWTQDESAARRAEAAAALARSYLYDGLEPEAAWKAKNAILALLDDPAPAVRRALAEACASCADAPRALVIALASDQPDIASIVLTRSPVLSESDLVDGIAIGCEAARCAIAARIGLSAPVAGAMAEIGEPASLMVLTRNHSARITTGALLRMVARHGDNAPLRAALLARPGLPLEVRQAATARLAQSLSAFAVSAGWLSPARSERASREARERATLAFSEGAHAIDLTRLVAHLRKEGELNAGLLLRAILSGHMAFAEIALADLAGLGIDRVAGLMRDASGSAIAALLRKAGLPPALMPAFTAALSAWREAGTGAVETTGAALSRRMIERALTACEGMPLAEAQSVLALLGRYEAEAARDEARLVARTIGEDAGSDIAQGLRIEILDVEWREAQRLVAHHPEPQAPAALAVATMVISQGAPEVAAVASADDEAVDAVLDALPDALMASFREEQSRARAAAADVVLEAIPDALIASYREDRARMRLAA